MASIDQKQSQQDRPSANECDEFNQWMKNVNGEQVFKFSRYKNCSIRKATTAFIFNDKKRATIHAIVYSRDHNGKDVMYIAPAQPKNEWSNYNYNQFKFNPIWTKGIGKEMAHKTWS